MLAHCGEAWGFILYFLEVEVPDCCWCDGGAGDRGWGNRSSRILDICIPVVSEVLVLLLVLPSFFKALLLMPSDSFPNSSIRNAF